jgi:hypothetical protein
MIKALLAACAITSLTWWPVDLATFANQGTYHTHVQVDGYVNYVACEADGDTHIRMTPAVGQSTPFIIAECIPALPCTKPALNAHIRVQGISRHDPEHNWNEVHPVESLQVLP